MSHRKCMVFTPGVDFSCKPESFQAQLINNLHRPTSINLCTGEVYAWGGYKGKCHEDHPEKEYWLSDQVVLGY